MNKSLYVKYMVSLRCKLIVREELSKLNINYYISINGAISFLETVTQHRLDELDRNLKKSGMELLDSSDSVLIDKITNTIAELIHDSKKLPRSTYSEIIKENFSADNGVILSVFSDVKGMSLIQYIVLQKIERIKELLLYEEMSLQEISDRLNYKSKNLLVAQFKNYTGLSPDYYIALKQERNTLCEKNAPYKRQLN